MISVLYVDDEPELLKIGKLFLEKTKDFQVDMRDSAVTALEHQKNHTYDAIVSDYQMPEMDGLEFLKQVRLLYGQLPFILFTGKGREEVVILALNLGADFYLQKGGKPQPQFTELAYKIRQAVQRRQAAIALEESERRYHDIVETRTEFISRFKPDGTHVFANEAYCRHFGKQHDEVIGHRFVPNIPKEDRDLVHRHFASFVPDRPVAEVEHRVIMPDGRVRWYWWSDHAFFDDAGRVIEYQSIGKDITERKQAEEALRESEEKFRVLADNAPVAIVIYQNARIVYVNNHSTQVIGYSKEELYSMDFWDVLHPDYQKKAKERGLARLHGENVPSRYEVKYVTKSGETRWADLSVGTLQYGGGPAAIVMMVGITERKKAEDELRAAYEQLAAAEEELRAQYDELKYNQQTIQQSEQNYRSILENIQEVYYRTDTDGNIILASPSMATLLGYSSSSVLYGQNVATALYANPEDRKKFLAEIERTGSVSNYEVLLRKRDGTPITVITSSHNYYDTAGNFLGVEGIFRDISDRKRAEEAARLADKKLFMMTEVTRHEISNIITGLIGCADMANALPGGEERDQLNRDIKKQALLIRKQLEFSKEYEEIGIHTPEWQSVRHQIPDPGVPVIAVDASLNGLEIYADPLVAKIFPYLVENVIRHGVRATEIAIWANPRRDGLLIVFEDNGVGIPAGMKSRIFERKIGDRKGMGLFLVREILGITGITITETGTPGEGARFEMLVPEGGFRFREKTVQST